jgi:hypothetical protein
MAETQTASTPAATGGRGLSAWARKNKVLAAAIAAGGGFLLFAQKGHSGAGGDVLTGGGPDNAGDASAAAIQLVPVAASPLETADLGDISSGVNVGGDLNSPLQGQAPRTGMEPSDVADIISALTPAAGAQAAAMSPPSHPGYTAPHKKAPPGKTSSHTQAGLHRTGGNIYKDAHGKTFHRVGKGNNSHFAKGAPPKHSAGKHAAPRKPATHRPAPGHKPAARPRRRK